MLIFDFDGVLMDSVREIAITAYNSLTGDIFTRLNQVPPMALELFLRNRFHVQPIGDALMLMQWCLENSDCEPHKLLSEKEYVEILRQADEPVASRTKRFFETRNRFKSKDIKAWLELNEPVQPIWRQLVKRDWDKLVILTNKNREATITLCRHFGLAVYNENIYSGDDGATKIDNFSRIMQRFKSLTYAFIDDSVKNLRQLDEHYNKGEKLVSLLFAEWGYIGPDDALLAKSYGYQSLNVAELIDQLHSRF
jgi:phosphoglycolate phosphatase-like HAD superfamily hydrolase